MGRWDPDAEGRLRAAALELFVERGYELTTVTDIAERAGLTARTFFRYFADKREVLFNGSARLQQLMVETVNNAPKNVTAMGAVTAAVLATSEFFVDNRDFACRRSSVIAAHAELRERELIKLANLSRSLAEALNRRGVLEPDASLAAEAGIAVFRIAFDLWIRNAERRELGEIVLDLLARLKGFSVEA